MRRGRRETIERLIGPGAGRQVWTKWGYRDLIDIVFRDGTYYATFRGLDRSTFYTWECERGQYLRVRLRDYERLGG